MPNTDLTRDLFEILSRSSTAPQSPERFDESDIRRETVMMTARDGIRLATDLYLPPLLPAPAVAMRTPYGRDVERMRDTLMAFARRGYVAIAQDSRGTGDSEPDVWDYYVYEPEDGVDFVEWATQQPWFDGHLYGVGSSYVSATQWGMGAHPRMTAIVPEAGGLQTTRMTVRPYMFVNGYPRTVGKSANRLDVPMTEIERVIEAETMAGGYFNEPLVNPLPEAILEDYPQLRTLSPAEGKRRLWALYCPLPPAERARLLKRLIGVAEFSYVEMCALPTIFDSQMIYGQHTIPSPNARALLQRFNAPALFVTGWYDWNLADMMPSWTVLRREAKPDVAEGSRIVISPSAHNMPGYHEGEADHPELRHHHRMNIDLMLRWYEAVREGKTAEWPRVIYYLMGANEWRTASDWPVPEAKETAFYLGAGGALSAAPPDGAQAPDRYTYDPRDPTPTLGGSIVSYLYTPGSVDVSTVQARPDVVTYTTAPLERDLDVVGPLKLVLHASSSAVDTDFSARLSDVFPDGRAIQIQSGMLRARYRDLDGEPALLEPGRVTKFEIDMWSTANRFKAGHRLRLDVASADFPRFDRNDNRGGEPGDPVPAEQAIHHDNAHPSHLIVSVLD